MRIFFAAIVFIAFCSGANAGDINPSEYVSEVFYDFQEECADESGMDYLNCWSDHSPEKCKGLVYDRNKAAWMRCVASCANASIYSKTFGDCSE